MRTPPIGSSDSLSAPNGRQSVTSTLVGKEHMARIVQTRLRASKQFGIAKNTDNIILTHGAAST
jgi:hypothetical protein